MKAEDAGSTPAISTILLFCSYNMKKLFAALSSVLIAGAALGHDLVLSWNPVTDPTVTGFKIYYGPSIYPATNVWRVALTNVTRITNLISAPTLTYRFSIVATNAAGTEGVPLSDLLTVIPPHAVKNPRFIGRTANGFTVGWLPSDEADAASYKVTYGTVQPRTTNSITVGATNTWVTITNNVVPDAEHYFSFTVINTPGVESWPMYELRDKLLPAGPPDLKVTVKVE